MLSISDNCVLKAIEMETRTVLLYQDEDGMWIAEIPSLPGCGSDGETREEALINIREAMEVYIESLNATGHPVPEEYLFHPEVAVLEFSR
jgi:predicted RNase H-like HicB family nuclease